MNAISETVKVRKRNVGRKRKGNVERHECGKIVRKDAYVVPDAALDRKAELLGIDPERMRSMAQAVLKICADDKAGTALGRMTWQYDHTGARTRRIGVFDGKEAPWITDAMVDAADSYRALWVHWHRLTGMPRRNPQGQVFDRQPRSHDSTPTNCQASPEFRDCKCEVCRTAAKLRAADEVLKRCRGYRLVWAAIEMVVIEDVAPDGLVTGERSAALNALRDGLGALARFFKHG